jgi:proline racemase
MSVGDVFIGRSIIGSTFRGQILAETAVGNHAAVTPTICGQGFIYGTSQFYIDPKDPWPLGYRVGDTWPNPN